MFSAPASGLHDIRVAYLSHENRTTAAAVTVKIGDQEHVRSIDMTQVAPLEHDFVSLGEFSLVKGQSCIVTIASGGAGNLHADAIQVLPVATK